MGSEESVGQGDAPLARAPSSLPAVRDKRVYAYRDYTFPRPGRASSRRSRAWRGFIHPERFGRRRRVRSLSPRRWDTARRWATAHEQMRRGPRFCGT